MPLSSALSQLHILCVARLISDTTDNPSEMCPLKLTSFCLFLYHWSYTILQGPLIPPMAFTSCHDRGSELATPRWESHYSIHAATTTCLYLDRRKVKTEVQAEILRLRETVLKWVPSFFKALFVCTRIRNLFSAVELLSSRILFYLVATGCYAGIRGWSGMYLSIYLVLGVISPYLARKQLLVSCST